MLLPVKLICERKFVRRNGTSLIYIQYCFSADKRTLLNTEIAIPPAYWNKNRLCIANNLPETFGTAQHLNDELNRMIRIVEDLVSFALKNKISDTGNFVKKTFYPHLNTENLDIENFLENFEIAGKKKAVNKDIYFQIEDYIRSKENKVSEGMIPVYKQLKERLKAFEIYRKKPITFDCLDYSFYEDFIEFLTFSYRHKRRKDVFLGLKVNSIGLTVKQLRVFINDRVRRKIIPAIDMHDFKVTNEETDAIYLTYDEVKKIYETDLSDFEYLKEYRNLFVLACLTGLRFSDFSTLKPEDLRKDMLYKKQNKSDHWVVIPLRKEAKEIFTQQFKEEISAFTNAEFNRHIKTIGKLAGIDQTIKFSFKKGNKDIQVCKSKFEWITTHTARRSFCTNEFLAGSPVKLIMKISGHKTEKDFYKYIRITPEEAGQKMEELWLERNNMHAFKSA